MKPRTMKRKPSAALIHSAPSRTERRDDHLFFYAQSCHKAAKTLAGTIELGSNSLGEFDAYPVFHMYRHAVELHLKAMVLGEGGNFLPSKPDSISVSKTRSVSWLAQFVVQIITALKWENEFCCEGVQDLAAFKSLIEEMNGIDTGHPMSTAPGDPATILPAFVRRLDALLDLLDSTADALAAQCDLQSEAVVVGMDGKDDGGFEPTIQ